MKKRVLSLVMALVLTIGLVPMSALAGGPDSPPTSVTVTFTAQAEGAFLCAPQFDAEVSSNLAESYGYTDAVENGVSALDVLVKAHEVTYGNAFTPNDKNDYLVVSNGSVSKLFTVGTYANGFILNGMYPHDGTESEYGGYTGTTVATQPVKTGDLVEFFLYQDSSDYSDEVAWFCQNGSAINSLTLRPDTTVTLTLKSVMYMMGYSYRDIEAMHHTGETVEAAQLAWVDVTNGAVTDIPGAVTSENGSVSLTMPSQEGTYYLTAYIPEEEINENYASPLVMSLLCVTVDADAPELDNPAGSCDLTALSIADLNSNPDSLALNPAFSRDVTSYFVDTVAFQQYAKMAYVKATAASDTAVIKAMLNGTEKVLSSGDSKWVAFSNLVAGAENILTITVAASSEEDAETKTYTVTIPMASDPKIPHLRGDSSTTATLVLGNAYTLDLSTVFEDADTNNLSYTVKISDAEAVTSNKNYSFQPTETGTYTLTFTASDGANTSPAYTVTLKVVTAAENVMHNIAAKYAQNGIASDANYPWLAADLASYAQLFPNTENKLTQDQIQATLDKLIDNASASSSPGDLAKDIIALRALGYDARTVVSKTNEELDVVKKLTDMVDAKSKDVSNYYTLPYVIIALQQGENYATQAQISWLIQSALESKSAWQNTAWGPDAATAMILALSPYYNQFKEVIDETLSIIANTQSESGALAGLGMDSAASTGLGMAAYAALGQSGPVKDGKTLTDGLMTLVDESLDGFDATGYGTFNTEQGFRGLIAAAKNNRIFDFDEMPTETARATLATGCPVEFHVIPETASVEVRKDNLIQTANSSGKYYLDTGDYTYTVSKSGYQTETGSFSISSDDARNHVAKAIPVSLAVQPSEGAKDIFVQVKVLTHDATICGGTYTYKHNADAYTVVLAEETVTLQSGQTAFEALQKTLAADNVTYSEKSYGYIDSIGGISEFDHDSSNSGWMYMVNGVVSKVGCRDQKLQSNATVVWFFTDDYTNEYSSESWSGGGAAVSPADQAAADKVAELIAAIGTVTDASGDKIAAARTAYDALTAAQKKLVSNYAVLTAAEQAYGQLTGTEGLPFTDVAGHWALEAIRYAYEQALMTGTTATAFSPEKTTTRGMIAAILYRQEGSPAVSGGETFSDVDSGKYYASAIQWAQANGIVEGYANGRFGPDDAITREQLAAILYRYAAYKKLDLSASADLSGFTDQGQISAYAADALSWANAAGLITGTKADTLSPKGSATRAQAATILMRFWENTGA